MTALSTFYAENRRYFQWMLYLVLAIVILSWLTPIIGVQKPARLLQSTITGLLVGSIYALIALGIVIINKASGVFNFAHGLMMLFGAMVFYTFFSTLNMPALTEAENAIIMFNLKFNPAYLNSVLVVIGYTLVVILIVLTMNGWEYFRRPQEHRQGWLIAIGAWIIVSLFLAIPIRELQIPKAIVGGVMGSVLIGLSIERFSIRPLIGQPLFASVLMTLAISEFMLGLTQMIWGSVEIPLGIFTGLKDIGIPDPIRFEMLGGNIIIQAELMMGFFLALLAFGGFVLFFRYTNVGLAMRATAENQQLAQSVGLRVRFILAVAWGIAALLAMVAGVLQGGATSLSLNMPLLALRAFPAVLLGGLESIGGALVGGLIIGVVQEWANLLFPGTQAGTELAPYAVLMLMLIIRPDGLFGEKRIERI